MLTILAITVTAIFIALGGAKVLALPPMRQLAAGAGFSVNAYRRIGVAELAGATGVALGLLTPLLGALAGAGLLMLLAGAIMTHVRRKPREILPAVVCAVLVSSYLVVLAQ